MNFSTCLFPQFCRSLLMGPVKQRGPAVFAPRLENRWCNGSSFACNIQMDQLSRLSRYCSFHAIRPQLIPVLTLVPSHLIAINDFIKTQLSTANFTMPSKMLRDLPVTGVKCPIFFPPGSISRERCSSVTFFL